MFQLPLIAAQPRQTCLGRGQIAAQQMGLDHDAQGPIHHSRTTDIAHEIIAPHAQGRRQPVAHNCVCILRRPGPREQARHKCRLSRAMQRVTGQLHDPRITRPAQRAKPQIPRRAGTASRVKQNAPQTLCRLLVAPRDRALADQFKRGARTMAQQAMLDGKGALFRHGPTGAIKSFRHLIGQYQIARINRLRHIRKRAVPWHMGRRDGRCGAGLCKRMAKRCVFIAKARIIRRCRTDHGGIRNLAQTQIGLRGAQPDFPVLWVLVKRSHGRRSCTRIIAMSKPHLDLGEKREGVSGPHRQ